MRKFKARIMSRETIFTRRGVGGRATVPLASSLVLLLAWSAVSHLPHLANVVPAPWVVAQQMWSDRWS